LLLPAGYWNGEYRKRFAAIGLMLSKREPIPYFRNSRGKKAIFSADETRTEKRVLLPSGYWNGDGE